MFFDPFIPSSVWSISARLPATHVIELIGRLMPQKFVALPPTIVKSLRLVPVTLLSILYFMVSG